MNRSVSALVMCLLLATSGLAQAETPASQPSAKAAEVAKQLKAAVPSFRLELNYNGPEDKPFYRLILSVPPIGHDRSNPFYRLVQIRDAQATAIIEHLAADGFLNHAVDLGSNIKVPPPAMPGYTLTVATTSLQLRQDLGWGMPMLRRLDGLRKVLEGDAAKGMDLLLGRLSGFRTQRAKKPDSSKLKEGITLPQAREILGSAGRLRRNSTAEEAVYDFDFDGKSAVLIVDRRADPAIVTKVIIWEHGKTVQEVRADRQKKWIEWIEGHSPREQTKTSMKGWELYVWQDGGETHFALLPGTNRLKTDDEIAQAAVKGIDAIKPKLDELNEGQSVFIHGRRLAAPAPVDQSKAVTEYCRKIGLKTLP